MKDVKMGFFILYNPINEFQERKFVLKIDDEIIQMAVEATIFVQLTKDF